MHSDNKEIKVLNKLLFSLLKFPLLLHTHTSFLHTYMKLWGSDPTPFSFISAFQFARIHTSSFINIEKILNRPVTKFYNCHYINVNAAWSWLTKTRPTSKAWKTKLKFLAYCINCFRFMDNLAWKWKYLPAIAKAQSHNGLIGCSCWNENRDQ